MDNTKKTREDMERDREEIVGAIKNEAIWMQGSVGQDYYDHRRAFCDLLDEYVRLSLDIIQEGEPNETLG